MARSKDKAASASSGTADGALDPALPQKKRARRRLVGAAALCLLAAIVLPLVLDSEPRRAGGDVQVSIPSRETPVPPLSSASEGRTGGARGSDAPAGPGVPPPVAPPPDDAPMPGSRAADAPKAGLSKGDASKAGASKDDAPKAAATKDDAPRTGGSRDDAAKSGTQRSDAAKPSAAESKPATAARSAEPPKAADANRRYMLQVGAFASEKSAAEQVAKVKSAGLSAYTEKVQTTGGERVRVRVGPFGTREQADQARGQLKLVGIDSALIAP